MRISNLNYGFLDNNELALQKVTESRSITDLSHASHHNSKSKEKNKKDNNFSEYLAEEMKKYTQEDNVQKK